MNVCLMPGSTPPPYVLAIELNTNANRHQHQRELK